MKILLTLLLLSTDCIKVTPTGELLFSAKPECRDEVRRVCQKKAKVRGKRERKARERRGLNQ